MAVVKEGLNRQQGGRDPEEDGVTRSVHASHEKGVWLARVILVQRPAPKAVPCSLRQKGKSVS